MKHNKHSLPFLLACFATAASLAGCTWDSSLYDDFVNKNTDSVMACYGYCDITEEITEDQCNAAREAGATATWKDGNGKCQINVNVLTEEQCKKITNKPYYRRLGITLPNGVYAYQSTKNAETYYCGTYDEIGPSDSSEKLEDAGARNCEDYIKTHDLGFSSFEAFKAYFEKMTQDPEEGGYSLCPANTLSCSPLHVQTLVNESDTIGFCNACEKDSVICRINGEIKCTNFKTEENCGECNKKCDKTQKCQFNNKTNKYECTVPTNCDTNEQYYYNNECKPNTLANCGKHNHNCKNITGWSKECADNTYDKPINACGACIKGVCVPSECNIGYHKNDNDICVADDSNNCGEVDKKCGQREVCTQGHCSNTCGDGEVRCEEGGVVSCADPDTSTTFCGARGTCNKAQEEYTTCEPGQACIGGECKQNSCTGDKTLCVVNGENVCINVNNNDANHCGACNNECSKLPGWKVGECKAGKCIATECAEDHCLNSEGTCVNGQYNSLTCGINGAKCNSCGSGKSCVEGECVQSSCDDHVCFYRGETCDNADEHCGKNCVNCNTANNASAGTCNKDTGTCTITECATGYHKSGTSCVVNTNEACAPINSSNTVNCNTNNHAKTGVCDTNGQCVATSCQPGYHVVDGKCVEDSHTACGASAFDCTTLDGWKSGICSQDTCTATKCNTGYCINDNNTCVAGTFDEQCGSGGKCQPCSNFFQDSMSIINATNCAQGKCIITACSTGYHVSEDELLCEPDSPTACGAHDNNCTELDGWKEGECKSGQCKATTCQSGFCLNGTTCVNGTYNSTMCGINGAECDNCTTIASSGGVSSQICVNGTCVPSECDENVCFYQGKTCENTNDHCGTNCENCNTANNASKGTCNLSTGTCSITECAVAHHLKVDSSKVSCVKNSNDACAPINSSQTQNCETGIDYANGGYCTIDGYCQVISCKDGYIANNSTGSHGTCTCDDTSCNEIPEGSHIKTRSCQDNECVIVSCETHYSPNTDNTACVCNSDSCNKTNIKNATQASCNEDNSECKITCPDDYPLNDSQDACECTSTSCTVPNNTCKNGECCRADDTEIGTKPNCCSGYTCQQNSSDNPTLYKCVNNSNVDASWPTCPKV